MPRSYTMRSKEEKLSIVVKQVLNGMPVCSWESQGICHCQVQNWTKAYLEQGESGLEPRKKPRTLACWTLVLDFQARILRNNC